MCIAAGHPLAACLSRRRSFSRQFPLKAVSSEGSFLWKKRHVYLSTAPIIQAPARSQPCGRSIVYPHINGVGFHNNHQAASRERREHLLHQAALGQRAYPMFGQVSLAQPPCRPRAPRLSQTAELSIDDGARKAAGVADGGGALGPGPLSTRATPDGRGGLGQAADGLERTRGGCGGPREKCGTAPPPRAWASCRVLAPPAAAATMAATGG
jgi:hypothetical protein